MILPLPGKERVGVRVEPPTSSVLVLLWREAILHWRPLVAASMSSPAVASSWSSARGPRLTESRQAIPPQIAAPRCRRWIERTASMASCRRYGWTMPSLYHWAACSRAPLSRPKRGTGDAMILLNPEGHSEEKRQPLAPRGYKSLDGLTLGLLGNSKLNADEVLQAIGELLAERYELKGVVHRRKQALAIEGRAVRPVWPTGRSSRSWASRRRLSSRRPSCAPATLWRNGRAFPATATRRCRTPSAT